MQKIAQICSLGFETEPTNPPPGIQNVYHFESLIRIVNLKMSPQKPVFEADLDPFWAAYLPLQFRLVLIQVANFVHSGNTKCLSTYLAPFFIPFEKFSQFEAYLERTVPA